MIEDDIRDNWFAAAVRNAPDRASCASVRATYAADEAAAFTSPRTAAAAPREIACLRSLQRQPMTHSKNLTIDERSRNPQC